MIEVLNEFTHSSDGLIDLGTVSVIVPVDTVCTVVFVVIVGMALEYLEKNSVSIPTPRPGPTKTRRTAVTTVRLFESHLLLLGIHPSRFVDRLDEKIGPSRASTLRTESDMATSSNDARMWTG
jgi:hypothetical protein